MDFRSCGESVRLLKELGMFANKSAEGSSRLLMFGSFFRSHSSASATIFCRSGAETLPTGKLRPVSFASALASSSETSLGLGSLARIQSMAASINSFLRPGFSLWVGIPAIFARACTAGSLVV